MKELHHAELASAVTARLGGRQPAECLRGVVDEKRLLGLQHRRGESMGGQRLAEPVPADVAGEVLPAGAREQIVARSCRR